MTTSLQCKKLLNSVDNCVDDCLQGLVETHPGLRLLQNHRVIIRADIDELKQQGKVTILSGGGSGHEPAHSGFVGCGMLSGAVAGAVFASPPTASILAAIRVVGATNPGGTLLIVKNYTGDRLNFGKAAEEARGEGINVEMVVVGEDCALTSADKTAGRRGLCGTILIHKIAGALAEQGLPLKEIVSICTEAVSKMGTIGVSLGSCSVPGSGPSFQLQPDEIELGLGIHGEAGVRRMKVGRNKVGFVKEKNSNNVLSAHDTVDVMFSHMTNKSSVTHLNIQEGDCVALVVNNLGGMSVLEVNIVARDAIEWLQCHGVQVTRVYCGTLMTSLEMPGVSLTVLHVTPNLTQCLDAPTSAPAWLRPLLPHGASCRETPAPYPYTQPEDISTVSRGAAISTEGGRLLHSALVRACKALVSEESQLNLLDTQSGDGDCGSTLRRGAEALLVKLGEVGTPNLSVEHPQSIMMTVASIAENVMGGSSGALYSLFFTAASQPLSAAAGLGQWTDALKAGNDAVTRYGGADPGDRTMEQVLDLAADAETISIVTIP